MLQKYLNAFYAFIIKHKLVLTLIFIFVLLRLPSLFAKEIVNDEGIYAAVARGMSLGRTLYDTIWDHKPPLLICLYYVVGLITNFHAVYFWTRLISIFGGIASIILFKRVLELLKFTDRLVPSLLLTFTILLGAPFYLNYEANAEVFIVLLVLVFLYTILKKKSPYLLGILLFVAMCLKMQAVIEMSGILAVIIFFVDTNVFRIKIKTAVQVLVGFMVPSVIAAYVLVSQGMMQKVISALFFDNLAYTEIVNPTLSLSGMAIPIRLVLAATFGLLVILLSYYGFRQKITKEILLICAVFLLEAFCVLFPLRAYSHYFIQLLPGIVLLIGTALQEFMQGRKKVPSLVAVVILFVHVFFFTNFFFFHVERHNSFSPFWLIEMSTDHFTKRIHAFTDKVNTEYSGKEIFLYTRQSWDFVYLDHFPVNKYVFSKHYWRNDESRRELYKEVERADLVVIVDFTYKYKEMQELLKDRLQFQYNIDGYNYYTVLHPEK